MRLPRQRPISLFALAFYCSDTPLRRCCLLNLRVGRTPSNAGPDEQKGREKQNDVGEIMLWLVNVNKFVELIILVGEFIAVAIEPECRWEGVEMPLIKSKE